MLKRMGKKDWKIEEIWTKPQRPEGKLHVHQHMNNRSPRRKAERKRAEKIFEEIMITNFQNVPKNINYISKKFNKPQVR